MFRHVIAPARFYSQVPNEIIRHPRLSSDAVRLLTWQLSLPAEAKDSLSHTARRAGIGACRFQRAKAQLKDEGYLHEWRTQGARGRWRTHQLVSNTALTAEQATAAMASVGPGGHGGKTLDDAPAHEPERPAKPQVAPGGTSPTVGRPTDRPAGGASTP